MQKFFSQKKALLFALMEDALFLVFALSIVASSVEILLPGSISAKIPLAFVFSLLAGALLLFLWLQKSGNFSSPRITISRFVVLLLLGILCFVGLLMNSDFGITASLVQIFLVGLFFFLLFKK